MSAVTGRAEAAVGNLTSLLDTVATPNGMYGEMVFMDNPNEFSPVSESACERSRSPEPSLCVCQRVSTPFVVHISDYMSAPS